MIGETAGSYRIVRQVGKGGMGAVYLGEHAMLGRLAAIKILLPALSQDREVVARFFNEARAATAIRHPGIVEIYDFGFLSDGAAFIAMEMLDGETVSARLRRLGRLPIEASLEIGRQVAAALQAAHHKGITHRDLKPDNVFLVNDPEIGERVKLLDFGIAKLVTEEAGNRTRTGVVMGTPMYMSPEQCRGATTLDSRADLYSLGCMLYELLSGRPPFVADSAGDIIAHHLYFQPEPVRLHEPSVPEPLEQLIMSLLAKEPAKRPASAADVAVILDRMRGAGIAQAVNAVALGMAATLPIVAPSAQHPAAKVATTISGSAAILPAASRSKGRWFAAAAVLVAAIGVGVT
ncbi:MAG TPA: serine/threonine-protein kinase, partial [Kofleriaceae bacterium]|nr:serine/threonine-protein kinase [Kofleriaceae bacterium]